MAEQAQRDFSVLVSTVTSVIGIWVITVQCSMENYSVNRVGQKNKTLKHRTLHTERQNLTTAGFRGNKSPSTGM